MSIAEKLTAITENQQRVYDAGKQAQEDAFWDTAQANGTRINYNRGFCGYTWTDETFKPKYDIKPTAINGFYNCFAWSFIEDFAGILERQGISLDTSGCSGDMSSAFSNSTVINVPVIDASKASTIAHMFAFCTKLERVEGLIVSATTAPLYTFGSCTALEHIIFGGTIGQNGLDLSACTKLDKESIESVINTLSTTTSGLSVTLSSAAVTAAFGSTTASEWTALIATRPNWTISLV